MLDFIRSLSNHIAQLANVERVKSSDSPFLILSVPAKNIAFHLIDFQTYKRFSAGRNCATFFGNLSNQYEQQQKQLVHVWEDVWLSHLQLIESRIAALLGRFVRYHARLAEVKKITNPALVDFLSKNHLQVPIAGRYKYGLFAKGELLAVASFSAVRPMDRNGLVYNSYELLRFANKSGAVVAGGLSRLLSRFTEEHNPDDIMTYADRDWGSGKAYRQLGFELAGFMEPQMFALNVLTNQRQYSSYRALDSTSENYTVNIFNSGSYKYIKLLKSI
ncbi:MAG: hypothetical protein LBK47_07510 [Prevotellaceae bacterium]|jgi:hypothetical protein|nr:hypothetical protein [Prevotellaceae bacterium]